MYLKQHVTCVYKILYMHTIATMGEYIKSKLTHIKLTRRPLPSLLLPFHDGGGEEEEGGVERYVHV